MTYGRFCPASTTTADLAEGYNLQVDKQILEVQFYRFKGTIECMVVSENSWGLGIQAR